MADYRDYVSFDPPEWAVDRAEAQGANGDDIKLSGEDLNNMKSALEEIASTPEGAALLERVAAKSEDGTINIMVNPGGQSIALSPNNFALGTEDSNGRYYSSETGEYHDITLQRLIVHELQHLDHGHTHLSPENEAEAIRTTNDYMAKYYGEPARDEDSFKGDFNGTPDWDVNQNFSSDRASLDIELPKGPLDGVAVSDPTLVADVNATGVQVDVPDVKTLPSYEPSQAPTVSI